MKFFQQQTTKQYKTRIIDFGMCAYVVGSFGIISTLRQPTFDQRTVYWSVRRRSALEAPPAVATSTYYLAATSTFTLYYHLFLERANSYYIYMKHCFYDEY